MQPHQIRGRIKCKYIGLLSKRVSYRRARSELLSRPTPSTDCTRLWQSLICRPSHKCHFQSSPERALLYNSAYGPNLYRNTPPTLPPNLSAKGSTSSAGYKSFIKCRSPLFNLCFQLVPYKLSFPQHLLISSVRIRLSNSTCRLNTTISGRYLLHPELRNLLGG